MRYLSGLLFVGLAWSQAVVDNRQLGAFYPYPERALEQGSCTAGMMYRNSVTGVIRECSRAGAWQDAIVSTSNTATLSGTNVYTGTENATGAVHTLPVKSGTTGNLPGTCTQGEFYFETDATAGLNVMACTSTNTWTRLGVATAGTGITVGGYNTIAADTAVMESRANAQAGTTRLCSGTASATVPTCTMTPTLTAYTAGSVITFVPGATCSGSPTTLAIDGLTAVGIYESDGTTSGTCTSGVPMQLTYTSGPKWRKLPASAHGGSHASTGSDPVTLTEAQITSLTGDLAARAQTAASNTFTAQQTVAAPLTVGAGPTSLTTVTDNPLSSGASTVNVVSTTSYPATGTLLIESEAMSYTGTTATSFTGCTRGVLGTSAASHASGKSVDVYLSITEADATHPKMVCLASGNCGVGTAAPSAALYVSGNLNSSAVYTGYIFSNGNAFLRGTTADSTANALTVQNSTPAGLMVVRNDGLVGIGTTAPIGKLHTVISATQPLVIGGATVASYTAVTSPTANKDYLNKTGVGTASTVGDLVIITGGTGAYTGVYSVLSIVSADSIQLSRTCHNSGSDVTDITFSQSTAPRLVTGTNRTYINASLSNATSNEVSLKISDTINKAAGTAVSIQLDSIETAVTGGHKLLQLNTGATAAAQTEKFAVDNTGAITAAAPGGVVGAWTKVSLPYTDSIFTAANTVVTKALWTVPAHSDIAAIRAKTSVAFAGTGITACSVTVGNLAVDDYVATYDLVAAVSSTNMFQDGGILADTDASHTLTATVTCNTAVGNGSGSTFLTAGNIDFWVRYAVLP